MKRRTFLQGFFGTLFLPLVQMPAKPVAQPLLQDLIYSDSDGNQRTILDALKDGNTTSGGIVYGA